MTRGRAVLASMLLLSSVEVAWARDPGATSAAVSIQLHGLGAGEADSLTAQLKDLQRKLRAGEDAFFELLSGAPASYPAAKISPREAFLQISFERVWRIERVPTDNPLWQPYRLAFAPNGLGQLYWDIEVIRGANGNVEQVSMVYKPPAPS